MNVVAAVVFERGATGKISVAGRIGRAREADLIQPIALRAVFEKCFERIGSGVHVIARGCGVERPEVDGVPVEMTMHAERMIVVVIFPNRGDLEMMTEPKNEIGE